MFCFHWTKQRIKKEYHEISHGPTNMMKLHCLLAKLKSINNIYLSNLRLVRSSREIWGTAYNCTCKNASKISWYAYNTYNITIQRLNSGDLSTELSWIKTSQTCIRFTLRWWNWGMITRFSKVVALTQIVISCWKRKPRYNNNSANNLQ